MKDFLQILVLLLFCSALSGCWYSCGKTTTISPEKTADLAIVFRADAGYPEMEQFFNRHLPYDGSRDRLVRSTATFRQAGRYVVSVNYKEGVGRRERLGLEQEIEASEFVEFVMRDVAPSSIDLSPEPAESG